MAQRLIRRQVVMVSFALAAILGGACGTQRSAVPTGTTGTSPAGVQVVTPSTADLTAMATAWTDWQDFSRYHPTCSVRVVPSSVKEAYIASTNLWWAIASVAPTSSQCELSYSASSFPFSRLFPGNISTAVFEKGDKGNPPYVPASPGWRMNAEASTSFPCGPTIGVPPGDPNGLVPGDTQVVQPGVGSATLPFDVLDAWKLTPAPGCAKGDYYTPNPPP